MELPLGFGKLDWSDWLRGAVSAFVSGGAIAITAGGSLNMADPNHFSLQHPSALFKTTGVIFLASGAISLANFLRQKPIPEVKTVTKTVEQTSVQPPIAEGLPTVKTVTKVEETHIEAVKNTQQEKN